MEYNIATLLNNFLYSHLAAFYLYCPVSNRHIWHNNRFGALLGIEEHELADNPVDFARKNYHPDDLKLVKKRQQHFLHHDTWAGYYRIRHSRGHYVWMYSKNQVLKRNHEGQPILIAGLMMEANHQLETQTQLVMMAKEEMAAMNRGKLETLTQREKEILCLIATGESYTRIASLLNIQPGTANRHRKNIEQKLGLHNIAMLGCFAKEAGLV